MFEAVQRQLKKNNGRSHTISGKSTRVYLLKGIAKCVHCGMPLWAETLKNGHQYYREQRGSRGYGECLARGKSIACELIDWQVAKIVGALSLDETWKDYIIAQISTIDERRRILDERKQVEERLKRLGRAFIDGIEPVP